MEGLGGEGLEQGWFRVIEPEPGVVCIEEPLHSERVKSYLIVGSERALLLDSGIGIGDIRAVVQRRTERPLTMLQSHAHFDHIGGSHRFQGQAEILVHPDQADALREGVSNERMRRWLADEHLSGPLPAGCDPTTFAIPGVEPTGFLGGGEILDLGGRRLEALAVPGHCPGLLALLDRANGVLWSTDAAYPGALYAQMPNSDLGAYRRTMAALADLAPRLRTVYPAHGATPMDPRLLVAMRDGLEAVAGGRVAETVADGVAEHRFDGFSVLVRAGAAG